MLPVENMESEAIKIYNYTIQHAFSSSIYMCHSYTNCSIYVHCMVRERERKESIYCLYS